ncbi:hypothetical protein [Salimicrobium flavidum]|uniref:Uncharacterized protein n=1 Tax=Salimicrobium flavidum TaxID=570947 RepID=A0A1N7J889_9BACI|nr:hypothetical protein [Salimicrobium flavidum]SIS45542.1 hypothetical protein SAMN05421687_104125 [Salimicrobium flavidum]
MGLLSVIGAVILLIVGSYTPLGITNAFIFVATMSLVGIIMQVRKSIKTERKNNS